VGFLNGFRELPGGARRCGFESLISSLSSLLKGGIPSA